MSISIKKETIQRLINDVKQIIKNPLTDNGIYYKHDETDMLKGYALIIGPEFTPYFGGYYFFKFSYPSDYPFAPPVVTYLTTDGNTRFNPNLYNCGKVCVSILNTWAGDKWSACQTITSVLLTLCTLLVNYPIQNEPGQSKSSPDSEPYQRIIQYENLNFAVCEMVMKYKKLLPKPLHSFYPIMYEYFLKNYEKWKNMIIAKNKEKIVLMVAIYKKTHKINYEYLELKLEETYQYILNNNNEKLEEKIEEKVEATL